MFAQEPDPYLARLAKRMRELQLQESLKTEGQKSGQNEGFHAEAADQVLGAKRAVGALRYVPQNGEAS